MSAAKLVNMFFSFRIEHDRGQYIFFIGVDINREWPSQGQKMSCKKWDYLKVYLRDLYINRMCTVFANIQLKEKLL